MLNQAKQKLDEEGEYDSERLLQLHGLNKNGFNVGDFGSQIIWCKRYSKYFSSFWCSAILRKKFSLLDRESLEDDWDPTLHNLTIWECCPIPY